MIAPRMHGGQPARDALDEALADALPAGESDGAAARFDASPSNYERHRADITSAYREVDGNLSRLEELLRSRGLRFNRRWLSVYLERWGVRRTRGRRGGAAER